MRLISRLLILVGFFIFFTYCGDNKEDKSTKIDDKTSNIKYEEKERYVKVNLGDVSPNVNEEYERKVVKKLVHAKGILGSNRGLGMGSAGDGSGYGYGYGSGGGGGFEISLSKGRKGEYGQKRKFDYNHNTEKYSKIVENTLKRTTLEPMSTFSIDVDTASYSLVKSMIKDGGFNKSAVRTEEFINYFTYDYPQPKDKETPFSVTTEVGPSILHKERKLIHIGIQGRKKADEKRKHANLVFLVDTSGSMTDYNKLPLLKKSLNILINNLTENDIITIVTYAGNSYVALEPTHGHNKNKIKEAINRLQAYGGTNGEGGILVAYEKAKEKFDKNKINRIILCTDGDFNIGVDSVDELKKLVKEKRKTGITLSTIGFGRGNYNDAIMENLADNGNGNYFYINDIKEAKKVFSKELTANLEIIAKDVKIQVEFNPKKISYYKLIGYENRILKKEDFNNDKVDAGEIGSGHSVTALYEVIFTNDKNQPVDDLRYGKKEVITDNNDNPEIAYVKLRYKKPNGDKSILINHAILDKDIIKDINKTSNNFRFSSAVAAFALNLINSENTEINNKEIIEIAKNSKSNDEFGYREEFINLVKMMK